MHHARTVNVSDATRDLPHDLVCQLGACLGALGCVCVDNLRATKGAKHRVHQLSDRQIRGATGCLRYCLRVRLICLCVCVLSYELCVLSHLAECGSFHILHHCSDCDHLARRCIASHQQAHGVHNVVAVTAAPGQLHFTLQQAPLLRCVLLQLRDKTGAAP